MTVTALHTGYTGLKTGSYYVAKVYAAKQSEDGNYHYAAPAETAASAASATLLPEPAYVSFTSVASDDGTVAPMLNAAGKYSQQLITNRKQPTLKLEAAIPGMDSATPVQDFRVEAYNGDDPAGQMLYIGDEPIGHMTEDGSLALAGLTTDGDYAVELVAQNEATGDKSVTVVYVTIDTSTPTLYVTSPVSTKAVEAKDAASGKTTLESGVDFNNFNLTGVTEPGSTLTANGTAIAVAKDGSFNSKMTLDSSLASDEIRLVATDKAGNVNRATVPVTNSAYAAPIGINVVRTGTMKPGTRQTAQVYLKYADGAETDTVTGLKTQKYRSEAVPAADKDKLSFGVLRGDAVKVDDSGVIRATNEGASLLRVSYQVNNSLSLDTTMAIYVDADAPATGKIGGDPSMIDDGSGSGGSSSGGGGGGGGAAAPAAPAAKTTTDVVINGKSETVPVTESGSTTIEVGADDKIDTTRTLTVENLAQDATSYVLDVDAAVARELSGETGEGVRFTGGSAQVDVPGSVMTGSELTITISEPSATETLRSAAAAKQLGAQVVDAGTTVTVSGAAIEPGDRVEVRFAIPAGADTTSITALVFIDGEGNSTTIPWKLDVVGNTAYVECYLPENGTLVPMSSGTTFNDVPGDYWGAAAIEKAAGQMLVRGYEDGSFQPEGNVTRAEFATVMLRAGGLLTARKAAAHYTDVAREDWFYDAIGIATALGIMKGYEDGAARPNNRISRVEGMVIASRMLKLEELSGEMTDAEADKVLAGFEDKDKVLDWAKKDVALCVKYGIINGIDGAIAPDAPLSRVQAAIIATRLSDAIADTL